ncbi:MAG TPA: ABC transporter permease [Firmicutes bacterium]|jgi:peptide/nickel transport system permease protein|nr:ABC transporter permease [Bacillota bacterium]HHT43687.1 ABC transporter permease [Bacillota bacterium]
MRRYLWRKLGGFILTALLVSFATFFILQVLPGDPARLMLGTEGSPEAYARLRRELGLDGPLVVRYLQWFSNFIRGQWGNSWRYSLPVGELVRQAFPLSFALALSAVGTAVLTALPAGMYMAARPRSFSSRLLSMGTQLGLGLPQFWVGLLLIQLFAVQLRVLPSGGSGQWGSLILPTVTLALPRTAVLSRFLRAGMLEALEQDYVRTAKAKGVPQIRVFFKHALRNGALGGVTAAGVQFAQLLAGTIVVEQVFGLPGIGQLLLAGVFQRDLPLVQTVVMLVVLLILVFDLALDLCLGLLDPRIRYD